MGTLESGSTVDHNCNGVDSNIDNLRAMRGLMTVWGFVLGHDPWIVEDVGGRHNDS